MYQTFERIRLGIQSITNTSPGWESYTIIAIIVWIHILIAVVLTFYGGRHLYKLGIWQANRFKYAAGIVLMIGAVSFFPVTFYSIGARQQASDKIWQQYLADAPVRQMHAKEQATMAFKERIAKFRSAQQPYYSPPNTYSLPGGATLPVVITYRDLDSSIDSSADKRNNDNSMLVTRFTIGEQHFTLTEHFPQFRTYNYSFCVNNTPDCLFSTGPGQVHCAHFTATRDICQLLFSSQHYLTIEATGPAVVHPSKIYDVLILTPPENMPLTARFTYCPISPGCMSPQLHEEAITEQSIR